VGCVAEKRTGRKRGKKPKTSSPGGDPANLRGLSANAGKEEKKITRGPPRTGEEPRGGHENEKEFTK